MKNATNPSRLKLQIGFTSPPLPEVESIFTADLIGLNRSDGFMDTSEIWIRLQQLHCAVRRCTRRATLDVKVANKTNGNEDHPPSKDFRSHDGTKNNATDYRMNKNSNKLTNRPEKFFNYKLQEETVKCSLESRENLPNLDTEKIDEEVMRKPDDKATIGLKEILQVGLTKMLEVKSTTSNDLNVQCAKAYAEQKKNKSKKY
ncbi:hypothetical protein E3N88_14558 [Mikania micrantha]|uniref:Uncharacterized protein n=1 Tax=Mikania micrantha TaxID=192012 RepID=A0A5N6P319_9ASTR|nr:hypothetical protein E3N88_14558 [Mikania micrantha]